MPVELPYGEISFCFSHQTLMRTVSPLKPKLLSNGRRGIKLGTDSPGIPLTIAFDNRHPPRLTENGVLIDTNVKSYDVHNKTYYAFDYINKGSQFALGLIRTGDMQSSGAEGICLPLRRRPLLLAYGWATNENGASYLEGIFKLTPSTEEGASLFILPQGQDPYVLEYLGENRLLIHKNPLRYLESKKHRDDFSPKKYLKSLIDIAEQARREMKSGTLMDYIGRFTAKKPGT